MKIFYGKRGKFTVGKMTARLMKYFQKDDAEALRQAFNHVYDRLIALYGRRNDQLAWHLVYWLVDNKRITVTPSDEDIHDAYTAYWDLSGLVG